MLLRLSAGEAVRAQPTGAAAIALDADAEPVPSIPLVRGAERVGAIECGHKREAPLTEKDRELLATLARQAALGIRNARVAPSSPVASTRSAGRPPSWPRLARAPCRRGLRTAPPRARPP